MTDIEIMRQRQRTYHEELERQVREKKQQKEEEKVKAMRLEQKLEEDLANFNPWGRGGSGAPRLDSDGNRITSRNVSTPRRYPMADRDSVREAMFHGDFNRQVTPRPTSSPPASVVTTNNEEVEEYFSPPENVLELETTPEPEDVKEESNSPSPPEEKSGVDGDTLSNVSGAPEKEVIDNGYYRKSMESPFNLGDQPKRAGRRQFQNMNRSTHAPFGVEESFEDKSDTPAETARRTGRRQFQR